MSIAANSRWNLFGFGCTLAAHLITIPFVIDRIGLTDFGRAGLVLAIWAPLQIGTVLGYSVVRLVSAAPAESQAATTRRALNNALLVCFLACLAIAAVVLVSAQGLIGRMTVEPRPAGAWRLDFAIAGIGWIAQQYCMVLLGASAGLRNYRAVALVSCGTALVNIIAILWITAIVPNSHGYLAAASVGFAANLLFWCAVTMRTHGVVALCHAYERNGMTDLLHFGKWQAVTQFIGTLGNQVDRYILGAIAPANLLGKFNAAFRLQEAVYSLVMKGSEVLFPYFGANSSIEKRLQVDFYLRASWTVMLFSCVLLVPAIPLAEPIIRLWAGAEVANGGAWFLKILVVGGVVGSGSNVASYFFMGSGQVRALASVSVLYSISIIAASSALLTAFGPYMAGAGIVLASALRIWHSAQLARKGFEGLFPVKAWLNSTLMPMIGALAVAAVFELIEVHAIGSWIGLILAYALIAGLVAAVACGLAAMTRSGRDWVRSFITVARLGLRGSA